jgi:hypothetical protein
MALSTSINKYPIIYFLVNDGEGLGHRGVALLLIIDVKSRATMLP